MYIHTLHTRYHYQTCASRHIVCFVIAAISLISPGSSPRVSFLELAVAAARSRKDRCIAMNRLVQEIRQGDCKLTWL